MKTNTILQGHVGGGKTRSLLTLLPEYEDERGRVHKGAGLTTLTIPMEPGYQHIFGKHGCAQGLHTHYHLPSGVDWDTISVYVKLLRDMSLKDVQDVQDPKKRQYTGFAELFDVCKNYVCDGCGKEFGPINELDDSHAVCLDSLSPLSVLVTQAVCGGKPVPSRPEYFGMLGFALSFLRLLFQATKCSVVLTAHIDRELDPVTGESTLTLDTIGQRLVKQIVKMPDELVTAYEEDGQYYWSNLRGRTGQVVKHRALPLSDRLDPSFRQIFHQRRTGK
jgi:hypothetical protein